MPRGLCALWRSELVGCGVRPCVLCCPLAQNQAISMPPSMAKKSR